MDSAPNKVDTEKMYEGIVEIFEKLQKRFIDYETNSDDSESSLSYITKLAGSIGYTAQVHSGLAKAYQHEKRLADLEKKFEKIPPEMLREIMKVRN